MNSLSFINSGASLVCRGLTLASLATWLFTWLLALRRTRATPVNGAYFRLRKDGVRVAPSRITTFARVVEKIFLLAYRLRIMPSAYLQPTIENFRMAMGFTFEADTHLEAAIHDKFVRRELDVICRGEYRGQKLTYIGRVIASKVIADQLRLRKRLLLLPRVRALKRRKQFFIISLPRTGTTIMQRLLCADQRHKAFTFSELKNPARNGNPNELRAQMSLLNLVVPHLLSIHPMHVTFPEEETFLLNTSVPFVGGIPISGIVEWVDELRSVAGPIYKMHREWVSRMVENYADESHTALVFKSPFHLLFIEAMLASIPVGEDVVLVRNRRSDMVKEVNLDHLESCFIDKVLPLLPRQYARLNEIVAERDELIVIDVDFDDIVRDPVATIRAVYRIVDLDFPPTLEEAIRTSFARNKKASNKYHAYHNFPLKDESIVKIRAAEAAIDALLKPIYVR